MQISDHVNEQQSIWTKSTFTKSTRHRNFLLMLCNDARKVTKCIDRPLSGAPTLWGKPPCLYYNFKLSRASRWMILFLQCRMTPRCECQIPAPLGSEDCLPHQDSRVRALCRHLRGKHKAFCKHYLHNFPMRQVGEATCPQRSEGTRER